MRTQTEILTYSLTPMINKIKRYWLQRKIKCCARAADVEDVHAEMARKNAAYFRIRAAQIAQELRRLD